MLEYTHMANNKSTEKHLREMILEDRLREILLGAVDKFDERNSCKSNFNYSLKTELKRKRK